MPKPIFSAPDDFSISPLLQLLPVKSTVSKLQAFNSSLYARYEKVNSHINEPLPADASAADSKLSELKSLQAELLMLKQVLDWLEITPDKA